MIQTQAFEKNIEHLPVVYLTKTMRDLYQKGREVAEGKNPSVLIRGEKGTGKELLAKSIHYNLTPHSNFFPIQCVDLPFQHFKDKIERYFYIFSENKPISGENGAGKKATFFFRNIEKLDRKVQTNLVDLLREKFYGTFQTAREKLNSFLFIFSSSQDELQREDLKGIENNFEKIFNPSMLNTVPLRDRKEDINLLALFFIDKFGKEYEKDIGGIHSAAIQYLESYLWPGNVSELRDVIENAVMLSQAPLITNDDLRFNVSKKLIALESYFIQEEYFKLDEIEQIYIQTVLRRLKNNKSKASKILGISRNTLQRRIDTIETPYPKSKSRKKAANQPTLF